MFRLVGGIVVKPMNIIGTPEHRAKQLRDLKRRAQSEFPPINDIPGWNAYNKGAKSTWKR